MKGNKRIYRGFLMTELIVSLTVLAMLLVAFAVALDGFRRFNHYQLVGQRCISAAQATLDSIAATGSPIEKQDFERLWPKINIEIDEAQGQGQWKEMTLVTVTAQGQALHRKVRVRLSRYFSKDHALDTAGRQLALQEQ